MKKDELQNRIRKLYLVEEPFELALKFCSNLVECTDKNSLTHNLLEMLLKITDKEVRIETVTFAFNIFSQFPRPTFILAVKAYRMLQCSKNMFIDKIKMIARDPWINQAAVVAMELKLCNEFDLEDILIPLFLENKMSTYMEYMGMLNRINLLAMMKYLDSLMDSNYEYERFEGELKKYNIKNVEMKNLKTLKTHIFKMRDRFSLKESDTPHATRYHYIKFLKFVMYEYYDNENFSKEIYEDKIKEIADKNEELQALVVEHSCERGYIADGRKWKEHYKLSIDISRYDALTNLTHEKTLDMSDYFYEMSKASTITFVDDEKSYREMLEKLAIYEFAGLDCEQQVNNDLSTIQIAVKDEVFIIDAMKLQKSLSKEAWLELATKFLNNAKILKLGCGIFHDITTIERFLPIKVGKASFIDLSVFGKNLFAIPRFKYPFHPDEHPGSNLGLSALTKLCFNKNLNKALAISNWAVRPLRSEQLTYAALDAHVALDIFHTVNNILKQLNLSYKNVIKK